MTLRVPNRRLGGQGNPWCPRWSCSTLRKIPWKFHVDIIIKSVSGRGCQEWGDLEDIEGSWPQTWRTGSSIKLWMYLVDPRDHILKVLCHYLDFWLKYKFVPVVVVVTVGWFFIDIKISQGWSIPHRNSRLSWYGHQYRDLAIFRLDYFCSET